MFRCSVSTLVTNFVRSRAPPLPGGRMGHSHTGSQPTSCVSGERLEVTVVPAYQVPGVPGPGSMLFHVFQQFFWARQFPSSEFKSIEVTFSLIHSTARSWQLGVHPIPGIPCVVSSASASGEATFRHSLSSQGSNEVYLPKKGAHFPSQHTRSLC